MAQPHDNDDASPDRRVRSTPRNTGPRRAGTTLRTAADVHHGLGDGLGDGLGETATNIEARRQPRKTRGRGDAHRGRDNPSPASPDWTDVLAAVGASFDWLCTRPHPVCVDGRAIPGLPDAWVPLDELRDRVIARGCPLPVSDAVWAHLASRSRTDGASWTVACAGMALPMLRRVVRTLTVRFAGDRGDVAAETVAGFVTALAVIDVGGVALFASLRWAAYRAGLAAVHAALAAPVPLPDDRLTTLAAGPARRGGEDVEGDGDADTDRHEAGGGWRGSFVSAPPPAVAGHPDLVLARAVGDGILSLAEAALIGSTRLEALSIAEAAAARGQSLTAATVARHRAEHRLRRYLTPTPAFSEPGSTSDAAGSGITEQGSGRPRTESRSTDDSVADSASAAAMPTARRRIRTRRLRDEPGGAETRR
jgi:hypothetical protein